MNHIVKFFKIQFNAYLSFRFLCTEIITNALPRTALMMIVPKINPFMHKIVKSTVLMAAAACSPFIDIEVVKTDVTLSACVWLLLPAKTTILSFPLLLLLPFIAVFTIVVVAFVVVVAVSFRSGMDDDCVAANKSDISLIIIRAGEDVCVPLFEPLSNLSMCVCAFYDYYFPFFTFFLISAPTVTNSIWNFTFCSFWNPVYPVKCAVTAVNDASCCLLHWIHQDCLHCKEILNQSFNLFSFA